MGTTVIIEGPDRVGKTTLIKNLRSLYFKKPDIITLHSSSPPKGIQNPIEWENEHYSSIYFDVVQPHTYLGGVAILDRFHLGATVYAPLYRGATDKDLEEIWDLDESMQNDNVYLILLTDLENGWKRDDGDSNESSGKEYLDVSNRFIDSFQKSSIRNKIHVDVTKNGGFVNTYPTVEFFLKSCLNRQT